MRGPTRNKLYQLNPGARRMVDWRRIYDEEPEAKMTTEREKQLEAVLSAATALLEQSPDSLIVRNA